MIKLLKNATVLTMNKNKDILYNIDLVIEDEKIIKIEKNYQGSFDQLIDCTKKVIMPGLINAHTHLGMSIFRNTNDNLKLMDWLEKKIWPIEDKMNKEDIYYANILSMIEMIKTGTTMNADFYFEPDAGIKSILKTKMRSLYTRTLMDLDANTQGRINDFVNMIEKYKDLSPLITFSVAPHSLYTCSEELLKKSKELADKYNLPIHMHFCETKDEVQQIQNKFNKSPIQVLEDLGYLENKLILAHGVFLDKNEINKLAKENIYIVHNPVSNFNLGCGIANIEEYLKNGLNICLGTDGTGSALNLNMFKSIEYTNLIQKGLNQNPLAINTYKVLELATIEGAKALGVSDIVGSIEINKKADLIILNYNNIEVFPINNLISEIVNNTSYNNVETTIINGEIVMKERKLMIDVNEEDLKQKLIEIMERLGLNE